MKLFHFALGFFLVLILAVATPARTQPLDFAQLPTNLNIALCMNKWDKALNILQALQNSSTKMAVSRQQLVELYTKVESYQAQNLRLDQSDACAAVIAAGGQGRIASVSRVAQNCTADGKCFSNSTAQKRHGRSWAEGDR